MKSYIVVLLCIMLFNSHVDASVEGLLMKGKVYGNKMTPLTDARTFLVEFGLGFIQGLQEDPEKSTSQCQTDVLKLGNIYDDFMRLVQEIKKKGFNFLDFLSWVNASFRTLQDIEEDCQVTGLFAEIWALRKFWLLMFKLGEILIKSYIIIPTIVRFWFALLWSQDGRAAGFETGFLMSTIFNYQIKFVQ